MLIKNKIIPSILFISLFFAIGIANANTLKIEHQASIYFQPEIVSINLSVETEHKDINAGLKKSNYKINQVITNLEKFENIEIKTNSFNTYSRYNSDKHIIQNQIQITTKNLEQVGKIIEIAINHGVNKVSNLNYSIINYQEAYDKVYKKAIKELERKVETINKNSDIIVKEIKKLEVSDNLDNIRNENYSLRTQTMSLNSPNNNLEIREGKIKVTINLKAKYQLLNRNSLSYI